MVGSSWRLTFRTPEKPTGTGAQPLITRTAWGFFSLSSMKVLNPLFASGLGSF
jgi:hypothetical protein